MDVLLTFTGSHDPHTVSSMDQGYSQGPVLTLVCERAWDVVCLFSTPRMAERTFQTKEQILALKSDADVRVMDVPLTDPTDYSGIFFHLRRQFESLSADFPEAHYYVSVSSGTPHMHAAWLMLVASGEIPATLLQVDRPEFVPEGRSCLREIDFTREEFPRITRSNLLRVSAGTWDFDRSLLAVCQEIGLVGSDPRFYDALRKAAVLATYPDSHILLLGETGAGKEYFAQVVHRLSSRRSKPMVVVNCSSIPENLFESQLFGHKKGSFTGAVSDQKGKFQLAHGGVLFLDEIGELPIGVQAKLLRALEQGEIEPIGAGSPQKVDVQVVAATNRNLRKMVNEGAFRQDLFQRFTSAVSIPPLRDRKRDIPTLAVYLLDSWNRRHSKARRLSSDALRKLTEQAWPGNVRELKRVVEQSAMFTSRDRITATDLTFDSTLSGACFEPVIPDPVAGFDLTGYLENIKRETVERALSRTDGVQARAARILGWSPQVLNQYLKNRRPS